MIYKSFGKLLLFLCVLSCNSKTDGHRTDGGINTTNIDTTKTHQFIARLYEGYNSSLYCGGIVTAYAYKFKVIETDIRDLKDKWIVVIQPCPDMLGNGFFKTGRIYRILTGEKNMDYIISNKYENETLPTFWSKEINLIK